MDVNRSDEGRSVHNHGGASRRVLVVGGGIAGFAMLRALDQRGIAAIFVERLNGPPEAGLGLNLPGNAVRALRDLGVGDALKRRGMPILRREYRNARGRLLSPSTRPASGAQILALCARTAATLWSFSARAWQRLQFVGKRR